MKKQKEQVIVFMDVQLKGTGESTGEGKHKRYRFVRLDGRGEAWLSNKELTNVKNYYQKLNTKG